MKKIIVALALVLALSSVAMAADVKVGGELRYRFRSVLSDPSASAAYLTSNLTVDATLNEKAGAFFELDNIGLGDLAGKNDVALGAYAYIRYTPAEGLPTLKFGRIDVGSSVLSINVPASLFVLGDGAQGIGVEGEAAGVAYNGYFVPGREQYPVFGFQAAYDFQIAKVGGVVNADANAADPKLGYAVQVSAPVPVLDGAKVYAEAGKKANEAGDMFIAGASAPVLGATLAGELNTIGKAASLSLTVPVDGLKFNVSYKLPTVEKGKAGYFSPELTGFVRINF